MHVILNTVHYLSVFTHVYVLSTYSIPQLREGAVRDEIFTAPFKA
jgi:hypothetical protein